MNETLEDFFSSLAQKEEEDGFRLPIKGVTVRLDAHQRAEISALCASTQMTRQDLLEAFVNAGLKTATDAYLGNSPPSVQADFAQEVHQFLIAEGVRPEISEQIAGIQHDFFQGDNQQ